jgi:prepilin-type N-terminal cleavage/methylation domain
MFNRIFTLTKIIVVITVTRLLTTVYKFFLNITSAQTQNSKKIQDIKQFSTTAFFKIPHKAFTLVELLVVIAIIGLLSTIAVVAMTTARSKARDTTRIADIKQISTALEQYYSDNNGYPGAIATGIALGSKSTKTECAGTKVCSCLSSTGFLDTCTAPTYMTNVPTYPGTVASDCAGSYGTPTLTAGQICYYSSTTSAASTDYKLTVVLENGVNGSTNKNCTYSNTSGLVCT